MRNITRFCAISATLGAFTVGALPVQAAEVDGPKVSWRFSTWGNPRAFTKGIETLAEIVKKKTDGNFTISVSYGEALSKARENLDGLKLNAFEGAHICTFYHPGKNPAYMVFSLPFLPLADWDVSLKTRQTVMQHPALVADMDRWNAIGYATTVLPQYEFLGRGEPPVKLADWKGRRVRAGGGLGDAMEKLGAIKTTTTATEIYTAMQRGTMDAASLPFTYAHVAYKVHEVSSWYTTNLAPGSAECPVLFNKTAYNELPPQYKKILTEAKPQVDRAHIDSYIAMDKKNLPMIESKLKPVTYTSAQLAEFRKIAGKPVWDEWIAENKDKFDAQGVFDLLMKTAEQAGK